MSRWRASLPAWAAWGVLVAAAAGLVALALGFDDIAASGDDTFAAFAIPLAIMSLVTGSVGLAIRLRRPGNRIGRLMAAGPVLMLSGFGGYAIGATRFVTSGGADVAGGLAATWGAAAVLPGIMLTFPMVVVLFPDGRLPGPRWSKALGPLVAVIVASSVVTLVAPGTTPDLLPSNPIALGLLSEEVAGVATALGTVALLGTMVLAVAGIVVRFRRSAGIERQQLKWLVAAVLCAGVLFPLSFVTEVGPAAAIDIASVGAVALVPLAIGVAILRYRLYEIDRLVSRTLSWAIVTSVLAAVFAASVVGLQAALAPVTREGTVPVAASTLLAFGLFQPLRHRVQAVVDRRFNRARYNADHVAERFGMRLRDQADLGAVHAALLSTVATTVQPTAVALWQPSSDPVTMSERP